MLDEMVIHEHVQWGGRRYVGHVDLGTRHESDDFSPAKNALVLTALCVNGSWIIPLSYFFVAGLTGRNVAYEARKTSFVSEQHHVNITCLR